MLNIVKTLKETAKTLVFRHTSLGAPTYRYNIEPIQLAYLIIEIERLKQVPGNIVEIGVARLSCDIKKSEAFGLGHVRYDDDAAGPLDDEQPVSVTRCSDDSNRLVEARVV